MGKIIITLKHKTQVAAEAILAPRTIQEWAENALRQMAIGAALAEFSQDLDKQQEIDKEAETQAAVLAERNRLITELEA